LSCVGGPFRLQEVGEQQTGKGFRIPHQETNNNHYSTRVPIVSSTQRDRERSVYRPGNSEDATRCPTKNIIGRSPLKLSI
jgi:hypothetical protein